VKFRLLCSSSPLPPSPPAEKTTARQQQAGQPSTGNGARNADPPTARLEFAVYRNPKEVSAANTSIDGLKHGACSDIKLGKYSGCIVSGPKRRSRWIDI
jgi:hypothetical protein